MLHRLSFWMALFVLAAVGVSHAQTPTAAAPSTAAAMPPGQIVAAKVTGVVTMVLDGVNTPLKNGDKVQQKATVVTANDSSVILVFSNGATTQLGADTSLIIEEFLQDPFKDDVNVGQLEAEPTRSHTRLHLTKGELVGKVVKLHHDQGSTYNVQTPVGAAGIRGTTFRIVFRPTGTGQAFAVFSLSTAEGNVNFQQNGQGNQGGAGSQPGQGPTQGEQPGQGAGGQPGTPQGGGTSNGGGVAVTGGQEVVVTISVDVNQTTGQVTVSSTPTITSTQPISTETAALITQQAQAAVVAAATTTFTSSGSSSTTTTGSSTTTTETEKKDETKTEEKKTETTQDSSQSSSGDSSSGSSSGGTSGGTSSGSSSGSTTGSSGSSSSNSTTNNATTSDTSSSTTATSGTGSNNTGSNVSGQVKPIVQTPSPAVTQPTPPLTPGAGKAP